MDTSAQTERVRVPLPSPAMRRPLAGLAAAGLLLATLMWFARGRQEPTAAQPVVAQPVAPSAPAEQPAERARLVALEQRVAALETRAAAAPAASRPRPPAARPTPAPTAPAPAPAAPAVRWGTTDLDRAIAAHPEQPQPLRVP